MGYKYCFESDNKVINKWNKNPYSKVFFICCSSNVASIGQSLSKVWCFQNKSFGFGRFLRKNIELVKFIFGFFSKTLQFICNIMCNVGGLKKVYRLFLLNFAQNNTTYIQKCFLKLRKQCKIHFA